MNRTNCNAPLDDNLETNVDVGLFMFRKGLQITCCIVIMMKCEVAEKASLNYRNVLDCRDFIHAGDGGRRIYILVSIILRF